MEKIKLKDGFLLREIAGENVVVPVDEARELFRGMIQLNGVGAFLWKLCSEETTIEQMTQALVEQYDVEKRNAECDVKNFVAQLKQKGLLDESFEE